MRHFMRLIGKILFAVFLRAPVWLRVEILFSACKPQTLAKSHRAYLLPFQSLLNFLDSFQQSMGREGCFPTFPQDYLPKDNLHICPLFLERTLTKVVMNSILSLARCSIHYSLGTAFVNPLIKSEDIVDQILIANYSPPIVALQVLKSDAEKLIELYPDDPAFGSPFNTTNETVVLSPYFKQAAAIGATPGQCS